jgi:hypothetical protein
MRSTLLRLGGSVIAGVLLLDVPGDTKAAQQWQWAVATDLTEQRVIGLLELPSLVGDGCGRTPLFPMNLYDKPSDTARSKAALTMAALSELEKDCPKLVVRRTTGQPDERLPTEESGYEIPAAIVYERAGSWYRIALQRGSAWMVHPHGADFLSYPDLLHDQLAYIKAGWDRRLWSSPGSGTPTLIPVQSQDPEDEIAIDVIAIRRVRQQSWIQVRLTSHCDGGTPDDQGKPITGWIPAHRADGRPSAWFYSRGC